jgi:hypothetical protein
VVPIQDQEINAILIPINTTRWVPTIYQESQTHPQQPRGSLDPLGNKGGIEVGRDEEVDQVPQYSGGNGGEQGALGGGQKVRQGRRWRPGFKSYSHHFLG